jgi:dienelactone hydrolase
MPLSKKGDFMKLRVALLVFAGLYNAAPATGQNADLAADAKAFGARDSVVSPDLSADGSQVIYVTPGPDHSSVAVIGDLEAGKFTQMIASNGNPDKLRWCNFVSAKRAVCQITGNVPNGVIGLIGFSRLLAINSDGSQIKPLGQSSSFYDSGIRQVDGDIIDWLDGVSGKVLMQRDYVPEEGKLNTRIIRSKQGLGVDRLDTTSLIADPVESPRDGASGYLTDGLGHVRLLEMPDVSAEGYLTGPVKYFYRATNSNNWTPLTHADVDDFKPLAVDAETNQLYALKKLGGRLALYAIKLDGTLSSTLVASNPRVDIDDVVRFGDGERVIGYTYSEDVGRVVYFDPEFKALAEALSGALPNLPLIDFIDSSHDGRKLLIHVGSDNDPGRYFIFDRDRKTLTPAMLDRPELDGRHLASVKAVTIPAPDGAMIPAYLTLPSGKEGKNLPAVVLPHGGPSSRDHWGFDWLAQFLAARGYAVIQPEYRGSAGFGDTWLNENGFKNWRTSIGDITAAAKWLGAQQIANPARIAIVGWSYGGYAALQSASTEPSLYKAVVAIAPVTDLPLLKQDAKNFTNAELVEREIGDGPQLSEGSPVRHAADITAPVLMFHGDRDSNVSIVHSQKMDAALKAAQHESELVTFNGLDHQLDDSGARIEMLTKIGALLDRTIGH